jgi:hypothetical protein
MSAAHKQNPEAPARSPATGQFLPGNRFNRQVSELRQAMVSAVSPKDMKQITEMLIFHAQAGDLRAIKMVYQWVLGKPARMPEPDRQDLEEWHQEQCRPSREEVESVRARVPVATALAVTREPVANWLEEGCARVAALAPETGRSAFETLRETVQASLERTLMPARESHRNGAVGKGPAGPGNASCGSCTDAPAGGRRRR